MALSEKGTKTAKDKIKSDKIREKDFLLPKIQPEKFKEYFKKKKQPKPPKRFPPMPDFDDLFPKRKKPKFERMPLPVPEGLGPRPKKKKKLPAPKKKNKKNKNLFADGGKAESFGMLSVKAGVDNNPKPTQADRIVGATKKKNGGSPTLEKGKVKGVKDAPEERRKEQIKKKKKMPGLLAIGIEIIKPKKPIKAARGGLAGRLAKRGYGKARS